MNLQNVAWLALVALLAGCANTLRVDTSHPSANYDSRVQFVVMHYTAAPLDRSLALLTHGEVSAHYLIGDGPATVYRLADERYRTWHAGESEWDGRTWLNSSSIGIEIVNPGYRDTPQGREWYPYSEAQVQALLALLKDIRTRYRIAPAYFVGHSDIAPLRKLDPGPLFPWQRLAQEGFGLWPDAGAVSRAQQQFAQALPGIAWYQEQLAKVGYAVVRSGELDVTTRHVLAAFQMHYRPGRYDGLPDAETAALLQVLAGMRGQPR
ncbi:N-acetylmuramoyl-L-alanine amidase [Pseudomonas sp. Marseille-Q5115]|uniref:N-acetylmuramoyl-L-alanine amidase n=1 Tax=Pseudomonas sp. Marseille-Q5115 TaxID=2866593 RepID=UPI00298EDBF0|nr:N-acetylmuramoyl-L-alanine amidase [Pseudomonas sp. Marseille-Q5115]